MRRALALCSLVVVATGCLGKVAGSTGSSIGCPTLDAGAPEPPTSSSVPAIDASVSSSSSSSGSSSGETCTPVPIAAARACVPTTAAANVALAIDVDDPSACLPCFTAVKGCSVQITNGSISLGLFGEQCVPTGGACLAVCGKAEATCSLPPLAPGTYTVIVRTADAPAPPRELVVAEGATATGCSLLPPGTPVSPLDASTYATSCMSDDECRLATFGDPCRPCACPNGAVGGGGASAQYAADLRASRSQCVAPQTGIDCAVCPALKAKCEIGPGSVKGTCTAVPG